MKINVEAINDLKEYVESNHDTFEHFVLLEYYTLKYLLDSIVIDSSDGVDAILSH